MKSIGKTAIMALLTLWLMSSAGPITAMEAEDAPESVTIDYLQELYEGVEFDHWLHAEMLLDCTVCHHHTTGNSTTDDSCIRCHANPETANDVSCSGCHEEKQSGKGRTSDSGNNLYHIDKPSLKGALHLQCVGCHQSESGPTECLDCHAFTPAGEKRFKIKK